MDVVKHSGFEGEVVEVPDIVRQSLEILGPVNGTDQR